MAFTEGSTLRHTSESKGAPLSTSMQAAFEGKDIEKITPDSSFIQTIENRFVTDPTDPSVEPAVAEVKTAEEVAPKTLNIDLKKLDLQLEDDQLDAISLLPDQKMPAEMRPALSQELELPPMDAALINPVLEQEKAELVHRRDDIELIIPERPGRPHHDEQHAVNFHALVEDRPEHPTATPKPTPFMSWIRRSAEAKENKLRSSEARRAARRRSDHSPIHASDIHEKGIGQIVHDIEPVAPQPAVQVEAAPTPEVVSVAERRRGSLDFLRNLRKKPEIVNDAPSREYINQLLEDEAMLIEEKAPVEEVKPEKASRFERAKQWYDSVISDIRTYGGLNYFANKWNRPGDWLMSREGGRQKARFNVVLGLTALAVGSKLLEGTTGVSPFAALHDFDFSPFQGSGHEAAPPSIAPHFESSVMTLDANSAVVDGSNQFNLPEVPEVPASVPIEETINNPAFTIENGQTGYALFDKLGLSHESWNTHAGDLLQFPDFYMEDGDVRLAHEGVLSEEVRQYLLDLKQGVEG